MDFFISCDKIYIMMKFDVIIIGAGAAGLVATGTAVRRGRSVAVLDMGAQPGRKIMASGGGKCNITNTAASRDRYFGKNPDFVRGALSRRSAQDILDWAKLHNIKLYEKTPGRYFCSDGAAVVLDALMHDAKGAKFFYNTEISSIQKKNGVFIVNEMQSESIILATGGISFSALGVSDAGYKIAKSFGHKIVSPRPGLCALSITDWNSNLAGVSIPAQITIGKRTIDDSLLFTHFGIGGPLAYRISLHNIQNGIKLNLCPNVDLIALLKTAKQQNGRRTLANVLATCMPARIAKWIAHDDARNIADIRDSELIKVAQNATEIFIPGDRIGYHSMASAEVTYGGVDTCDISSKTMESKLCPGLFFAGEVIDITGDLGGFNLQWAWASGFVAGENA